jgi:hypothetical protein|tara:strand:+ start:435 stop:1877 length:1443 start_codon:yes stop_codon:yes gene_type:complete
MAISRAQMEEQIRGFNAGGINNVDVFEDYSTGTGLKPLDMTQFEEDDDPIARLQTAITEALKADQAKREAEVADKTKTFSTRYDDYVSKLTPLFNAQPEPTGKQKFFDLASDIGAAMLSADPTAGAFRSAGAGFAAFNERQRKSREDKRAIDQSVALKAFELAQADEAAAQDYLNKRDLKRLELDSKPFDPLVYEIDVTDNEGKVIGKKQVRVDPRNKIEVMAVEANPSARLIRTPQSSVTVEAARTPTRFDEESGKAFAKLESDIFKAAEDAANQNQLTTMFLNVVKELGPENFGAIESQTLPARKILSDLGLFKEEDNVFKYQELANTLGTRIAMGLVGQTKGAITEMEMRLFIAASPGLASTYDGALEQASILQRMANRNVEIQREYSRAIQNGLFDGLETDADKLRQARAWITNWRLENPFFNAKELQNLRDLADKQPAAAKAFGQDFLNKLYGKGDSAPSEQMADDDEEMTTDFS